MIYQGFFTLCALAIGGSIDQAMSDSIAGIGGVLLVGVGINLLGIKQIPGFQQQEHFQLSNFGYRIVAINIKCPLNSKKSGLQP